MGERLPEVVEKKATAEGKPRLVHEAGPARWQAGTCASPAGGDASQSAVDALSRRCAYPLPRRLATLVTV